MSTLATRSGTGPAINRASVERIVREIVQQRLSGLPTGAKREAGYKPDLKVNISARHMHITPEHLEILFGSGSRLTVMRELYQEGQFASEQTVTIIGPRRRMISNMRILGPCRDATQIELAFTDAIALGIDAPVRMSGDHHDTPGCIMLGPKGHVELKQGVIRAQRHVHMHPRDAAYYGISKGDPLDLIIRQETCTTTFHDVIARIDEAFKLEVHIDTDEGNACDLTRATSVELRKP